MVTSAVEPLKSTVVEGTIAERLVLLAGIVLVAYGLVRSMPFVLDLVASFTGDSDGDIFVDAIAGFVAVTAGLVVVVLAVALDFEWSGH